MIRRRLALLTLLAAATLAAPAAPAWARPDEKDGKGKGAQKDGKDDRDPKKTPAGRACADIGAEFARADASALTARIRPKGKLRISLGESGDYGEDQASEVLGKWFRDKKDLTADLKSMDGLTGKLVVTYGVKGSDAKEKRTLYLTLEKKEKGEGFWLAAIELV